MELNNRKIINGWCMYDWANSVYSLVITSAIFPIYYNAVTSSAAQGDTVNFLGFEVVNTVLYAYSLSFSFLFVAIILPLLSGIADYSGKKMLFMKIFMYTGATACLGLFFFTGKMNVEVAIFCSMLASVGYSGSLVFYDAFLPEITTDDRFDKVSAKGFALGYVGSVILLILNLVMIQKYDWFGFSDEAMATRVSFLTVGAWWILFSQITFSRLPDNVYRREAKGNILTEGYRELSMVWKSLGRQYSLKRFLWAFLFYNMGVQTVMYMAATFGSKELQLPSDQLIITVLIIQLVAIGGAYLFAYISKIKGNRFSLLIMVGIWVLICVGAYFVYTATEFFILAFVVGLVMGGIQSLSRSTYAKLIPANSIDHASYFSFYDVTFNISIVVGTMAYGLIEQITGNMRNSTLALMIFFVIGIILLFMVRIPAKRHESEAQEEV
ncbi:MFS transporter [Fulvivirga sediminis]|uniref:MFS transporter n=1 Tax=Fulvivirga sediminis TaxID=2803949 RepID=A0A937F4J6_9BACT|nr:MFS transporter [Fulvivirga sediminis]MBL3655625.1 MFS transporter [Fulvivirga sediminis]